MAFSFLDFATESKRVRLSRWEGGDLMERKRSLIVN